MKKTIAAAFALMATCFVVPAASAAQFGFGVAGIAGRGLNIEDDNDDTEFDTRSGEIGFMFDTGNYRSPFNYRLVVAYNAGKGDNFEDDQGKFSYDYDYDGLMVTNSFRFSFAGRGPVRFSVGPSIYIGALKLEDDVDDTSAVYAGIGPTFGIDIDIGPAATLALELGYRYGSTSVEDDSNFADFESGEAVARMGWLFGQ